MFDHQSSYKDANQGSAKKAILFKRNKVSPIPKRMVNQPSNLCWINPACKLWESQFSKLNFGYLFVDVEMLDVPGIQLILYAMMHNKFLISYFPLFRRLNPNDESLNIIIVIVITSPGAIINHESLFKTISSFNIAPILVEDFHSYSKKIRLLNLRSYLK